MIFHSLSIFLKTSVILPEADSGFPSKSCVCFHWQATTALPCLVGALATLAWRERLPRLALATPALIALEALSRRHPGDVNSFRPLLHELAARDPNVAVRRLAVICLKNGTPQPATLQLLEGIAESEETEAELRKTARVVGSALRKKAVAR